MSSYISVLCHKICWTGHARIDSFTASARALRHAAPPSSAARPDHNPQPTTTMTTTTTRLLPTPGDGRRAPPHAHNTGLDCPGTGQFLLFVSSFVFHSTFYIILLLRMRRYMQNKGYILHSCGCHDHHI